ncbi:hypothetical protein FOZ62_015089 [Perkinsus olseni]|uniref:Uncharacterized protein n=1 Tax=Perkinsus olseni TaxID=32597 RepID=A0A7J6PWG9_PEROL|nr:hypothetical protein FOZ62_015089 [Perkinsus olseni]
MVSIARDLKLQTNFEVRRGFLLWGPGSCQTGPQTDPPSDRRGLEVVNSGLTHTARSWQDLHTDSLKGDGGPPSLERRRRPLSAASPPHPLVSAGLRQVTESMRVLSLVDVRL